MIPHVVTIHHSACRGDSPPPAVFRQGERGKDRQRERERERAPLPLKRLFFPVEGSQAPADQQPTPLPLSPHLSPSNPLFLSFTASPSIPLLLLTRPLCIFIFQNISFFLSSSSSCCILICPISCFLPVVNRPLTLFLSIPPLCSSFSPFLRLLTVSHWCFILTL